MTLEQSIVFAVLGGALVLFAWGRLRFDLVALLALLVLTWSEIVSPDQAFRSFGHPAVVTVVAVLIISRAFRKSGAVRRIVAPVVSVGRTAIGHVGALTGLVAVFSAFMNNVGALALMMPVAIESSRRVKRSVSQVLMPLSFASLLGGLMTLIGTPPNIIIATYRGGALGEPFSMFDFTPVGAGVAAAGVLFVSLVGWRLLPVRKSESGASEDLFQIGDYLGEAKVPEKSPFIDRRLHDLQQEMQEDANVVGLIRHGRYLLTYLGTRVLQAGDILILEGEPGSLKSIVETAGLEFVTEETVDREMLASDDVALIEVVVSPGSQLEGQTPSRVALRRRYGLNLLAISRQGRSVWHRVGDTRFKVGDVLLLQAEEEGVAEVLAQIGCWPLAQREIRSERDRDAILSVGLFAAAIGAVAAGLAPIHIAFATVAVLLVMTRCLTLREAYESIDWPIIILIGAMLPVGQALQDTGATGVLAAGLLSAGSALPPLSILVLLLVLSMWLSDIVNNAAAAVVMAPLATTVAGRLDANPDAFLMAVAVGASCTFLTPIGHQSNALVMGPGGYRFQDYWRMGLPLDVIVIAVATALIYLVWW